MPPKFSNDYKKRLHIPSQLPPLVSTAGAWEDLGGGGRDEDEDEGKWKTMVDKKWGDFMEAGFDGGPNVDRKGSISRKLEFDLTEGAKAVSVESRLGFLRRVERELISSSSSSSHSLSPPHPPLSSHFPRPLLPFPQPTYLLPNPPTQPPTHSSSFSSITPKNEKPSPGTTSPPQASPEPTILSLAPSTSPLPFKKTSSIGLNASPLLPSLTPSSSPSLTCRAWSRLQIGRKLGGG